jgi:hypothetical protein
LGLRGRGVTVRFFFGVAALEVARADVSSSSVFGGRAMSGWKKRVDALALGLELRRKLGR